MVEHYALGRRARRLVFDTVPDLWPELAERIRGSARLEVSLDGVEAADSAALALLLEGLALARRQGCVLQYTDLPAGLLDLARMSNVAHLLTGEEGAS